ncbi:Eukaryotic translation initiation factor 2A [Dichanthelium oligosanthes]|uniref:Eukaryotic translation initiation factor 2A n=1 Tax=Dichanthelium oligosanthes TaxID=888268 RepID=A0A1E5VI89_9POAL|nr:Eukaryotic translation initiation factor 2A [Dichanthelium oligosanthes]
MASPPPALEILVREPDGFTVWSGPPYPPGTTSPPQRLAKTACSATSFSADGARLLATVASASATVYDCRTLAVVKCFELPGLLAAALSPTGAYLQTFQKLSSPQEKNVTVWQVDTAVALYQHYQKSMSKATWPMIQFSADESVGCRMMPNEIQFLDPKDFTKGILSRIRMPGIAAMQLATAPGSHVAGFVPEAKGVPASVQIFSCNKDAQNQAVARRSFFRCSTVQLHWNKGSTGLLVLAQADVDKTNQSYYGETKLNYLTTDRAFEGIVPLSKLLLFSLIHFTKPHALTISLTSLSRPVIVLAGFGNLPGDMAFWDYSEKKLIAKTKAECSVTSEWSPDGRHFMTATTAPRLQIDNGIKIFDHNGSLQFKKMFERLYQADWKPEASENFGEITDLTTSLSSLKIEETKRQVSAQGSKSAQTSSKAPASTASKPSAYRPPHAKGSAEVQDKVYLYTSVTEYLFGGLASTGGEMSKNALRNKKRREKQKEKKAAEGSGSPADES